jgi:PAS domain S-box-containing protein
MVKIIQEIGTNNFTGMVGGIKNESISIALRSTNDKILEFRNKEQESSWITNGVASIAALKHTGNDDTEYSRQIISVVTKYLKANQGAIFVLKNEGNDNYLEMSASYAYDIRSDQKQRIYPGEGSIGQIMLEKELILLNNIPEDYFKINSGLGEASPTYVCILPLISDNIVYGAIEIASFHKFQIFEIDYLKKISENIGYTLSKIQNNLNTQNLLKVSQQITEELKLQEEELRQNMEELNSSQEDMRKNQLEMNAVLSSLSSVELDLKGNIISANDIFLGITGYKLNDIKGKLYKNIIPQDGNNAIQYEMMWNSILAGQTFSGEFKIVNHEQKEMWITGNFTPILDIHGQPYKIMIISLFSTQDKEKLFELQEIVSAIKGCFHIVEFNPDLSFKSANELFLSELGIKRMELKKISPQQVFAEDSFTQLEAYIKEHDKQVSTMAIDIRYMSDCLKKFHATFIKLNNGNSNQKRGLLILWNRL